MNTYFNNSFSQNHAPYLPVDMVTNPFARQLGPKKEIKLGYNLFGPNFPSVVKLYDPMSGQVKAVIDPMNPGKTMSLEEYESVPQQQGFNPFLNLNPFGQMNVPSTVMSAAPFDILPKKKTVTPVDMSTGNLLDTSSTTTGWSISNNPSVLGRSILTNNADKSKIYSGSGIILLEVINSKFYLTLVKTKRNCYEDLGGDISKDLDIDDNTLKNNAVKEALEESQGLLYIKSDLGQIEGLNRYVDIEDGNGFLYRCYLIVVRYAAGKVCDLPQSYIRNKSTLGEFNAFNNLGADWNETFELRRFDFKPIVHQIIALPNVSKITSDIFINNEKGQQTSYKLRARTVIALYKLIGAQPHSNFSKLLTDPVHSSVEVICNSNNGICYITL